MDMDTVARENLNLIAKFIYEKQIGIIIDEIKAFIDIHKEFISGFEKDHLFVITGLSAEL